MFVRSFAWKDVEQFGARDIFATGSPATWDTNQVFAFHNIEKSIFIKASPSFLDPLHLCSIPAETLIYDPGTYSRTRSTSCLNISE